jgi:integrase
MAKSSINVAKINLPYVHIYASKGRQYVYYRRDGQRVRIKADMSSPEFLVEYNKVNQSFEIVKEEAPTKGSLGALIEEYLASPDFSELAPRTKKDYRRFTDILKTDYGNLPIATMPRAFVFKLRDKYAETPRKANYIVSVLRLLMSYAVDRGWRDDNPALRPKRLKEGSGYKPWTMLDVKKVIEHTKDERIVAAIMLALYTGQRPGDLVKMLWSQYDGVAIEVKQGKTGQRVWIPVHRELKKVLDKMPRTAAVMLTTERNKPWRGTYLQHKIRDAVVEAGLDGLTLHGLRKTATTMLADAGCTEREIMAITGHKTSQMVTRYVDASQSKKRAESAIIKLEKRG